MNAELSSADRLLSIDELDRGIVNLSSLINSSRFELLVLIRQFDERAGWSMKGSFVLSVITRTSGSSNDLMGVPFRVVDITHRT